MEDQYDKSGSDGNYGYFLLSVVLGVHVSLVGIPVNLKSTCISMAAAVLLLWGMIIKKKKCSGYL